MVAREDYGNAGREGNKLVPAALTAYRHFRLTLTSQGGVRLAPMTGGDSERYMVYDDTSTEFFEAKCIPFATHFVGPGTWWRGKHPYYREHPTPSLECTCGFYAHYYPDTDFYEDEYWKLMEDTNDLTGARITVRAVVEAAGRVVAGDLGVRAERIKVKALAVDWDKLLISVPDKKRWAAFRVVTHRPLDPIRDQLMIRAVKDVVAHGAYTYRAEFYDSTDVMHGEYPQQDLSALGINAMTMEQWKERKRRDEERRAEEFRLQVASSFGNVFGGRRAWGSFSMTTSSGTSALTRQDLEEIFGPGTVTAMRDSLDASIAKRAADTPMQRAILNKKNRPAPPGTGIDRRKRKL